MAHSEHQCGRCHARIACALLHKVGVASQADVTCQTHTPF
jgi:hypothetical protein